MGAAELKLAKFAEAANHLAYAIRNFPPSGDPKKKAGAERLYGEARQKVGALDIVAPAGAEVFVDGKSMGKAPLTDPVYVDPGPHKVEAKDGERTGSAEGRVLAAESTKIEVKLGEASKPPGPVTQPPGGEQNGDGPPLWPGIVMAAAGGVGIGVGIGLFAAGGSEETEAAELVDGIACHDPPTNGDPPNCQSASDKLDNASGLQTGGVVSLTVGGALAAGGIVYLIWASQQTSATEEIAVRPLLSPDLIGAGFSSSF